MTDQYINKQLSQLRTAFRKELREAVNDIRLDTLYQQLLMQNVFERPEPLAAMTSWSIAPEFAWWLYQHVINTRPEKIIELGSGTSTLVIASALKQIGKGRFLSFEHDYAYLEKTRALLKECDLQDYVELLYAPLETQEYDDQIYRWYSLPYDLIDHMIGNKELNLLLIDGPPAATNHHARYPAMVRLHEYCNESTVVLLDDAGRDEEQEILTRWTERFGGGSHQMLNNVRHGPALFFPELGASSIELCEDALLDNVNDLVTQDVEQLLLDAIGKLTQENVDEMAERLLTTFYQFRERGEDRLKLKYSASNQHGQVLEAQVNSLQQQLADVVATGKQQLAESSAAQKKLDTLVAENQSLSQKVETQEASLAAARTLQLDQEQRATEQARSISKLEAQREEQLAENTAALKKLDALIAENQGLSQKVETQEASLAAARTLQLDQEQRATEQARSISKLEAQREEQLAENTAALKKLDALIAENQSLSQKLEAQEASLSAARTLQFDQEHRATDQARYISKLEAQRDEQLAENEAAIKKLHSLIAENQVLNQKVEVQESSLAAAARTLQLDQEHRATDQARSISKLEAQREEQLAENTAALKKLNALLAENQSLSQKVETQEARLAAARTLQLDHEHRATDQARSISKLEVQRDEQLAENAAAMKKLHSLIAENQVLDQKVEVQESSLVAARTLQLDQEHRATDQARSISKLEAQLEEQLAENKLIRMQLDKVATEGNKLSKNLDAVTDERNVFKTELNQLAKQHKLVYKSLVYQLGMALYNQTRSKANWAKIPLAISRVVRRHAGSGNPDIVEYHASFDQLETISAEFKAINDTLETEVEIKTEVETKTETETRPFSIDSCSDDLKKIIKNAGERNVLWAASQIAEEHGYQAALQFSEEHSSEKQRFGVNLLRANMVINSESDWLHCFNAYLKPFNLAPVSLSPSEGARFSRLCVEDTLPPVHGPKITVIMPAFNAEAMLAHAAQSVLSQTWRNLQLIIVDDCSSDKTYEIAEQLAAQDSRVIVLRNTVNVGPYVSKNLALRVAEGKYITGHDADDWCQPQRLENDMREIENSNGTVLAVLSDMIRMNADGRFGWFTKIGPFSKDGASRVSSISLLIDADYLRSVLGGWDCVRFGADSEFIARAEKIMSTSFKRVANIGMFCLESDTSLTSDPLYGVSKTNGVSPTRQQFKESFVQWHKVIDQSEAYLPCPQVDRKFLAPDVMLVPASSILQNADAHEKQLDGKYLN